MADDDDYQFEYEYDNGNDNEYEYEYETDEFDAVNVGASFQTPALGRQVSYNIMDSKEMMAKQKQAMVDLSEMLGISLSEAGALLRYYRWNIPKVIEEWDEESIRDKVGIRRAGSTIIDDDEEVLCAICFDSVKGKDSLALACNHRFCKECWGGFLSNAVQGGPTCIFTSCPQSKCNEVVPDSFFELCLGPEDLAKYQSYLLRSFAELNATVKWCPAPNCEHAVEYPSQGRRDIVCRCGNVFCFKCTDEAHRPLSCESVKEWAAKNTSESENSTWILVNSKSCPSCKINIQKNQGCNHMTCRCGHQFCWLCMGDWKDHVAGKIKCNQFGPQVEAYDGDEQKTKLKRDLDRYLHYYQRFMEHQKAMRVAASKLHDITVLVQSLVDRGYPLGEVTFLVDAQQQVIACRRVLKWTYPYGFYLQHEAHRPFFEFLQGSLENNVERLHSLMEKPLERIILMEHDGDVIETRQQFYEFKSGVVNMTKVVQTLFDNLTAEFETGFSGSSSASLAAAHF